MPLDEAHTRLEAGIYVPPQRIGIKRPSDVEVARITRTVRKALVAFGIEGYAVADLRHHSNVTARVVSADGAPLAMRLRSAPGVDAHTEFEWLKGVRQGTTIGVVEPFASDFRRNTRVVTTGGGPPTECSLFHWAEGVPLAARLTPENYASLGRVTARLHEFAATWEAPEGLRPLVWDRTLYYEGTRLVIPDASYAWLIPRETAKEVESVVVAADDELQQLACGSDRRFLHGNIEMWNVLITDSDDLRLLDFEDVMFGAPVQDIAITLFYGQERADYSVLCRAYEAGYRSVREWPVRDASQLKVLMAARAVMLLNYALGTETDKQSVTDRFLPLILAAC